MILSFEVSIVELTVAQWFFDYLIGQTLFFPGIRRSSSIFEITEHSKKFNFLRTVCKRHVQQKKNSKPNLEHEKSYVYPEK